MKYFFSLFLAISLLSCEKTVEEGNSSSLTLLDQAYGNDPKQKLDIYLPANRNSTSTKLLILIHGGGWVEGDKRDFNLYVKELQRRFPEYAIANINYRLYANNQNGFPTQENDTKSAIDYLINKSIEYKISKQIALLGASAGAHLSMLYGYKYKDPVQVKAIVSFFGPSELVSLYNNTATPELRLSMEKIIGGSPDAQLRLYQNSSPINFIGPQSPPTILLHGGKDPLVPLSQSTLVADALKLNNVVNELVVYPNEQHGWVGLSLIDSIDKIEAFLKKHF